MEDKMAYVCVCDSQLGAGVVDKMRKNEKAVSERIGRPHALVLIQVQHVLQQVDKLAAINQVGQLVNRLRERSHVQL